MKFTLHETIRIDDVPERSVPGLLLFYQESHDRYAIVPKGQGICSLTFERRREWERAATGQERKK